MTSYRSIPTCENLGVTRPGIEPGSPWWEASRLTAQPPAAPCRVFAVQGEEVSWRLTATEYKSEKKRKHLGEIRQSKAKSVTFPNNENWCNLPGIEEDFSTCCCIIFPREFPNNENWCNLPGIEEDFSTCCCIIFPREFPNNENWCNLPGIEEDFSTCCCIIFPREFPNNENWCNLPGIEEDFSNSPRRPYRAGEAKERPEPRRAEGAREIRVMHASFNAPDVIRGTAAGGNEGAGEVQDIRRELVCVGTHSKISSWKGGGGFGGREKVSRTRRGSSPCRGHAGHGSGHQLKAHACLASLDCVAVCLKHTFPLTELLNVRPKC
ncbi:hypothetical protein PR048_003466 [Dryococelus australis]|uniref:Uncharacterized protein n=1 Tax=Dryococelus australis TaxID=614101 RepID=A0ABQ9IN75_9NEOP|nr:hypothetical protein PR048_003466 [Dryococelus australis]